MRIIDIEEVKKHLERLVEEAALGNSFIIAKAGRPLVKVVAFAPSAQPAKRHLGFMKPLMAATKSDKSVD